MILQIMMVKKTLSYQLVNILLDESMTDTEKIIKLKETILPLQKPY